MAQATICDRCGTIFKAETDVKKHRYHVFDAERDTGLSLATWHEVHVGNILDLCDKCNDELAVWVKG